MAIKQQITSVSGVTAEYHRISEAMIDYNKRETTIIVLSYLGVEKRDEEKVQANIDEELKNKETELNQLVINYDEKTDTPELKARREELTHEVNAMYERTPEDVAPRNVSAERYQIELPDGVDFSLEFAYGWLKENVYKDAVDC